MCDRATADRLAEVLGELACLTQEYRWEPEDLGCLLLLLPALESQSMDMRRAAAKEQKRAARRREQQHTA